MSKSYCKTGKMNRKKYLQDPRFACRDCNIRVYKKDQICKPEKMK